MHRFALLSLLVLSGCATYNAPVRSDVDVSRSTAVEGGTMAVVIGSVVVEDEGGLEAHVGAGQPNEVYRSHLAATLPAQIRSQSTIDDAFVGEPDDAPSLEFTTPAAGTTYTFDGRTPDWVLVMRKATLLRAQYQIGNGMPAMPGQPSTPQGIQRAVRTDVEILLWDNRAGQLIATGEVESEETFTFSPSSGTYEAAVGEFVEKLIENTPMERQR